MNAVEHIRTRVFKETQTGFAAIAQVSQPTVSRWEAGTLEPGRDELALIRQEALARGLPWQDQWIFEAPPFDEPERAA